MVHTSIQTCFAAQARRTPDAPAVSAGDTVLTYQTLDARANRLAHRLLGAGVRPGEPVAVLMERSPDLVVAILAVVKAGGCYLPLHSAHPLERMQQIMDHADLPVLLADAAMRERGLPRARLTLDPAAELASAPGLPAVDPEVAVDPDEVAYIIHTSGSTGEPKGVAVTHRGVLGLAADPVWEGEGHLRVLSLAPYAFGVSTYELWVPLLRGGAMVLPPAGDVGIRTVRELIASERITAVHVTAGLFRVFAQEAPESFRTVREVLTGGDVISPTAVRQVLQACPQTVVRAMYGATEMSSFAAHSPMRAPYEPTPVVPVGRPLEGIEPRLLDERMRPVPEGEVGELYVAGSRLAQGYYRRPDLTAERFVPDPQGGPGARMYRTGDLMRRTPEGLLEFAGRAGDLVKIRGYRVEPGEVEHVLARQPGVVHAAVVVQESEPGSQRLVAYVVPEEPGTDLGALRAAAARTLPEYMVPSAFVELPALPLTANGKLDRAALPEPEPAGARRSGAGDRATASAANGRQALLCRLFASVLDIDAVGIHDSFFDLGGESLHAMRLASRIADELHAEVSVGDVLNYPTVAELDARLGELAQAGV